MQGKSETELLLDFNKGSTKITAASFSKQLEHFLIFQHNLRLVQRLKDNWDLFLFFPSSLLLLPILLAVSFLGRRYLVVDDRTQLSIIYAAASDLFSVGNFCKYYGQSPPSSL